MAGTDTLLPIEVEEFLSWMVAEKGRSANTLAAYRRDLADYAAFLTKRKRRRAGTHARPADVPATCTPAAILVSRSVPLAMTQSAEAWRNI